MRRSAAVWRAPWKIWPCAVSCWRAGGSSAGRPRPSERACWKVRAWYLSAGRGGVRQRLPRDALTCRDAAHSHTHTHTHTHTRTRARVPACLSGGAAARQALHARIARAQQRAVQARGRSRRAHKDLAACREEDERARQQGRGARAAKQRLAEAAAVEQEWGSRPGAQGVLALVAGPLAGQVGPRGLWGMLKSV
jgi:hypothetical protein